MKKLLFYCIPVMLLLSACRDDVPDPEVKPKKEGMIQQLMRLQHVQASPASSYKGISVQHFVKGNAVYIDCKVSSVSFRENSGKNQAKIVLKVDDLLVDEYNTAAFVVRNLKAGKHKISLELVNEANESYHLGQEFTVVIS
ncbi:hypothetical protein [Niallia sp. 03190]|uniref:hypothetical protein n=1 Tax=Niallia sp. 03190 TaxID=3458061 RepID=UPI0040447D59